MDKLIYTMLILATIYASWYDSELKHREIMQMLTVDPCQEHHKLQSTSSRDFKPAYNRKQAKQVISTCGELE